MSKCKEHGKYFFYIFVNRVKGNLEGSDVKFITWNYKKKTTFVYSQLPNIQISYSRWEDIKEVRIKREVQRHIKTNQAPLLNLTASLQTRKENQSLFYEYLCLPKKILFDCFQIPNPASKDENLLIRRVSKEYATDFRQFQQ